MTLRKLFTVFALISSLLVYAKADAQKSLLSFSNPLYVSVPGKPFAMATTTDGKWLFVAITSDQKINPSDPFTGGGVAVFKISNGQLVFNKAVNIKNSTVATGMTLSHDGKLLIVTNSSFVSFLDVNHLLSSDKDPFLGSISDGPTSGSIYVNTTADDSYLFVSDEHSKSITVINLAKARAEGFNESAIVGKIPVGNAPIALTFSPDEKWLYTTSEQALQSWGWSESVQGQGAVIVINVALAEQDPANSVVSRVPAGKSPVRIAISHDGNQIYVTARGDNNVLIFNSIKLIYDSTQALIGTVPVGPAPVAVTLLDKGQYILVANSNRFAKIQQGSLSEIEDTGNEFSLIGTIPAGLFPREFCESPVIDPLSNSSTLFVSNYSSREIEVIGFKAS